MPVLRIGRLVGVLLRRIGVANTEARVAQRLSLMIAMLVMPIGRLDGVSTRRLGVAVTEARVALQLQVVARESWSSLSSFCI